MGERELSLCEWIFGLTILFGYFWSVVYLFYLGIYSLLKSDIVTGFFCLLGSISLVLFFIPFLVDEDVEE